MNPLEVLRGQTPAHKGPPAGFSRGVNDALITASTLVHFKAAGLLGFALTLAGLLLSRSPAGETASRLHLCGIAGLVISALFSGAAIFPLKNTRRRGVLFWGDIATHESVTSYAESLALLDADGVEKEYAATNF